MELEEQKTLRTPLWEEGDVGQTQAVWDKIREMEDNALAELRKAITKHPLFPHQLIDRYHEVNLRGMLSVSRKQCDNPHAVTAYDVINEEYYEFLEAVVKKDKAEAMKELAQVMAMCLRVGLHLEHYLGTEDHREQRRETVQEPA